MVLLLETRQEPSLLKCKEEEYKTNVSSSTPNNWLLFDEEVATLLLDMQQKVLDIQRTNEENNKLNDGASSVPSQDKQDNMIRNRKRKSPPDSDVESIEDEEEEEFHHMEQEEDDDEWMEGKTTNGFPTHYSPTDKLVRKKAPSGSACDKHKRWKKRCPDDCPMRKTKSLCRDTKRPLTSDYFDMFRWSIEESTMVEEYEEECLEEEEQQVVVTQRSRRSPPRRFEEEMGMMSEEEEEEEEEIVVKRKTKKTTIKNSKGRTGRKYLPQACDRHKVLHAKCPANCPDRLKRDADLANKQRIQQNPPGSSSSSEDLLSASNGLADYNQF